MSQADLIERVRRCAARLQEAGLASWSEKIRGAIDSASTGGELVMSVRWQLDELRRSGAELPEDIAHLVDGIVRDVNATGW